MLMKYFPQQMRGKQFISWKYYRIISTEEPNQEARNSIARKTDKIYYSMATDIQITSNKKPRIIMQSKRPLNYSCYSSMKL